MNTTKKTNLKTNTANFFGALGYFSGSLQWLWVLVLYFSWLNNVVLFISPSANEPAAKPPAATFDHNSPIYMIFAAVVTIFMVTMTIYVIYKIPKTIAKTSKQVVQKAATNTTTVVLHVQHKKDIQKNRLQITPKITIALKLLLILTPVVISYASQLIEKQSIDFYIAMVVSIGLAAAGVAFFVLQYIIASLLSVKLQKLW